MLLGKGVQIVATQIVMKYSPPIVHIPGGRKEATDVVDIDTEAS